MSKTSHFLLRAMAEDLAELSMIVAAFQRGQIPLEREAEVQLARGFVKAARRQIGHATIPSAA